MSSIKNQRLDVTYASISKAQKLDIFIPEGKGPFPAVVLIHGGGFFSGDKESEYTIAKKLVENGYVAVPINYRLSGEAVFPAAVHDCKAAIRFIRANAKKHKVDPEKIGVWGASAGGNLSAMMGVSSGDKFIDGTVGRYTPISTKVRAVVDWFGPINFSTMESEANDLGLTGFMGRAFNTDIEAAYLGLDNISDDPDWVALANPTTYMDSEDSAFFIQVGDADPLIPYTQSVNFYKALLKEMGADKVKFELLKGAGHGGSQFDSDLNLEKVITFLNNHLK